MSATANFSEASYYRARYYDQSVGLFLSEDPIRFLGGIDFYTYADNSPTNLADPFGLFPKKPKVPFRWRRCTSASTFQKDTAADIPTTGNVAANDRDSEGLK